MTIQALQRAYTLAHWFYRPWASLGEPLGALLDQLEVEVGKDGTLSCSMGTLCAKIAALGAEVNAEISPDVAFVGPEAWVIEGEDFITDTHAPFHWMVRASDGLVRLSAEIEDVKLDALLTKGGDFTMSQPTTVGLVEIGLLSAMYEVLSEEGNSDKNKRANAIMLGQKIETRLFLYFQQQQNNLNTTFETRIDFPDEFTLTLVWESSQLLLCSYGNPDHGTPPGVSMLRALQLLIHQQFKN
jgi:hypothetical protein